MLYYSRLQVYPYSSCVKVGYGSIAVYRDGLLIIYVPSIAHKVRKWFKQ